MARSLVTIYPSVPAEIAAQIIEHVRTLIPSIVPVHRANGLHLCVPERKERLQAWGPADGPLPILRCKAKAPEGHRCQFTARGISGLGVHLAKDHKLVGRGAPMRALRRDLIDQSLVEAGLLPMQRRHPKQVGLTEDDRQMLYPTLEQIVRIQEGDSGSGSDEATVAVVEPTVTEPAEIVGGHSDIVEDDLFDDDDEPAPRRGPGRPRRSEFEYAKPVAKKTDPPPKPKVTQWVSTPIERRPFNPDRVRLAGIRSAVGEFGGVTDPKTGAPS